MLAARHTYAREKMRDQLPRKYLEILLFSEFPKVKSGFQISFLEKSILLTGLSVSFLLFHSQISVEGQIARFLRKASNRDQNSLANTHLGIQGGKKDLRIKKI